MTLVSLLQFIYEDKITIYHDITAPGSLIDKFETVYSGSPRNVPVDLLHFPVSSIGVRRGHLDIEIDK